MRAERALRAMRVECRSWLQAPVDDSSLMPDSANAPAILDMLGGQLPAVCGPLGDFLPHLAGGKCRLLAASGEGRNRFAPGVPTFTEQGLKDMVFSEWFGPFLPGGAPADVVQRANAPTLAASMPVRQRIAVLTNRSPSRARGATKGIDTFGRSMPAELSDCDWHNEFWFNRCQW
jgi:hypothetical protein